MHVRDRIREFRRVPASELRPNPKNWRTHPDHQRDALRGVLAEVGYADALLARECPDGSLELIDGHLRAETTPDQEVPVLVLDVDEREAELILATLDPLAGLAEFDPDAMHALFERINPQSPQVQGMLADLERAAEEIRNESNAASTNESPPAGDDSDRLREKYEVLVECTDEQEQAELLERLSDEGYRCRALIA